MDEDRLARKVLLNCVEPKKEPLYGNVSGLDVEKVIEIARDREKWKKIWPPQRHEPSFGGIVNEEGHSNQDYNPSLPALKKFVFGR